MLLKFLTHIFCSSSLDKERSKTDRVVAEYHEKEAQVKARLQRKADECRDIASAHAAKRNQQLDEFVTILNTTVTSANDYLPHLASFQDCMFMAFNSWMQLDAENRKVELIREKLNTLYVSRDLLNAFEAEIQRLTQKEERHAWHLTLKERPVRVNSDLIKSTIEKLERTRNTSARQFKMDVQRIRSHKSHLRAQIREMEHDLDKQKSSMTSLQQAHSKVKADLNQRYRFCVDRLKEMRSTLEDYYCRQPTMSPLADSWIGIEEGLMDIKGLKALHREHKDNFEAARLEFQLAKEERSDILNQIQYCKDSGDFSNFDSLKASKINSQQRYNDAKNEYFGIRDARTEIFKRPNEVDGLLSRINRLSPDQSILNLMKLFEVDDSFNPMWALGVSTAEQRRLHWEKRSQTDGSRHVVEPAI